MAQLVSLVGVNGIGKEGFPVLFACLTRPVIFNLMIVKSHVRRDLAHELPKVFLRKSVTVALVELGYGLIRIEKTEIISVDLVAHHNKLMDFCTLLGLFEDRTKGLVTTIVKKITKKSF